MPIDELASQNVAAEGQRISQQAAAPHATATLPPPPPVQNVNSSLRPNYADIGPGAASGTTKGMDPTFAGRLQAMIAASGGRLSIESGYRSEAEQQGLWDKALKQYGSAAAASKWVAPPGHSNHGKGIAADLRGDIAWAHAHAAEFGLYFPMSWEPWHVEPTGSRGGKGAVAWTGPQASDKGYTAPRDGYGFNPDPGLQKDPKADIGFQLSQFASLLGSPDFAMGGPASLPPEFSSMPPGTT